MAPTIQALVRHVVVGSLWRPVKRRAERELIAELTRDRYSSFPFISPDTFRSICDVIIENRGVKRRPMMAGRTLIFFDLSEIEGTESRFSDSVALGLLEQELSAATEPPVVVMSHGDLVPTQSLMSEISLRSAALFSINLTEETDRIRSIPLGLENFSRNSNGRLSDYLGQLDNPSSAHRDREVFASFEVDNNPEVRVLVAQQLRQSRFGWSSRRLSPEDYRRAVKDSLFVISPPGRGLDCHRTWEAIYLGAVPVVLDGTLPITLLEGLPIHSVADYESFLAMPRAEMLTLFRDVRSTAPAKAYMPYWISQVLSLANS